MQKNPYHLHEFTRDEFVAFLHRSFEHVQLLSQHVYPVSYIWDPEGPSGPIAEYQVSLEDERFRPAVCDHKEIGYLIAVCAIEESARRLNSLLVDLSEVAYRTSPSPERWQATWLFLDAGAGFRAEDVVREEIEYRPAFTLKFTLDPSLPIRGLRWDPLESHLCQVRLRQVLWEDSEGLISRLDLGQVTSNGLQRDTASFEFETIDPMIYLPISGSVASITIDGECVVADLHGSLLGMEAAVQSRSDRLARQDGDLQLARQHIAAQAQSIEQFRDQLAREEAQLRWVRGSARGARAVAARVRRATPGPREAAPALPGAGPSGDRGRGPGHLPVQTLARDQRASVRPILPPRSTPVLVGATPGDRPDRAPTTRVGRHPAEFPSGAWRGPLRPFEPGISDTLKAGSVPAPLGGSAPLTVTRVHLRVHASTL